MKKHFYSFCFSAVVIAFALFGSGCQSGGGRATSSGHAIRVVVWDERQEAQKTAYGDYLGNTLAAELAKRPGLTVKSVGLNDPEQGLTADVLNNCDVLIWWGHQKHGEVTDEHVKAVVERLQQGKLSLVALHSAHWSKPFIEAMNLRTMEDALNSVPKSDLAGIKINKVPAPAGIAKASDPLTPWFKESKDLNGENTLEVHLPRCVFPIVRNEGKPSHLTTLLPDHPIAKGIPAGFDIPQTEVYAGPFHVPKPDAVIFEERWNDKESFTSGCAWHVGKGRVFYFRPGHETYAIYKQPIPLKIVENAIHWVHAKR
jgi:trehalose utilization protein